MNKMAAAGRIERAVVARPSVLQAMQVIDGVAYPFLLGLMRSELVVPTRVDDTTKVYDRPSRGDLVAQAE